jgi:membrane protein YqaA with SNARE-associated domain
MDAAVWIANYGLLGLLIFAFLAATLLPFSSEIAVLAALQLGLAPGPVLLYAALGNCLGAMTNYALGYLLSQPTLHRLQRCSWSRRALTWAQRYGGWSLVGSWLPLVGDPLMLISGMFRFHTAHILVLGLGTRLLRYAVLIGLLQHL